MQTSKIIPMQITPITRPTNNKVYVKQLCKIITDKTGLDATAILNMSNENLLKESRVELAIKDILNQSSLSIKEKNALKKTLTKSYFTLINKTPTPDGYVSLSNYVKAKNLEGSNIRASEIKKLLIMQSYLVGNYVTDKSYRLKAVHTTFITYELYARSRKKDVLKLWKVTFLDRIIKQSAEQFKHCRSSFSYTRPRSETESRNAINRALKILTEENPSLEIDSTMDNFKLLEVIQSTTPDGERTTSLLNYLRRHLRFRINKLNFRY